MTQLLDDGIRKQLLQVFSGLTEPVSLIFFGSRDQNCEYCEDTLQLLEEISGLSDKLELVVYDLDRNLSEAQEFAVEYAPAICIGHRKGDHLVHYGIRYYGVPGGHEFSTLIRDILMVSARDSGLKDDTREFLKTLFHPIQLQVFVTPTCPYCPQAVFLAHQMAFESGMVEADMVEATEFPDLADRYGVSGVPHTIINEGAIEIVGAVPEAELLGKIQQVVADEA